MTKRDVFTTGEVAMRLTTIRIIRLDRTELNGPQTTIIMTNLKNNLNVTK